MIILPHCFIFQVWENEIYEITVLEVLSEFPSCYGETLYNSV